MPESPSAGPQLRATVVVLAGGSGSRAGAGLPKVYRAVAGVPVVMHSLWAAARVATVNRLLLVVREQDRALAETVVAEHAGALARGLSVELVTGGSSRHGSEWAALSHLSAAIEADPTLVDVVAIHDGARPLADPALFAATIRSAWRHGGAVPVTPADDVVALGPDGHLYPARPDETRSPADHLSRVQTPQAFQAAPLLAAYRQARREGFEGSDTATCVARYSDLAIRVVRASTANPKITYADDVAAAGDLIR